MSNIFATLSDEDFADVIGGAIADSQRSWQSELWDIRRFVGMPVQKAGPGLIRPSIDEAEAVRQDAEIRELLGAVR